MAGLTRRQAHLEVHAGADGKQREILLPVMQAIRAEELAGGPLLVAAVTALLWANLAGDSYQQAWETSLRIAVAGFEWQASLHHVINDGLLPLFFFVAGLELKRELVRGELSTLRAAALPAVMAAGGMIVPALIYLAVTQGTPAAGGWGIPVATDIAFALALLAVLGDRIPNQVRIALLAFAALDDVGGVIVIAATYQSSLSWPLIGLGALLVLAVFGLQRLRVLPALLSILVGLAAFGAVLASGLHPTLAGIALGFAVPTAPLISRGHYLRRSREIAAELTELRNQRIERESRDLEAVELVEQEDELLGRLEALTVGTESSQDRISRSLNPWVSYVVLPLFALANGGVMLNAETFSTALSGPAFWGVVAGLVIGKPLGIVGLTWLACRLGLARLPDTMGWGDVAGLGLVAGIGFTVSLFIGELAFGGQPLLPAAKLGILCASLLAGLCGALLLAWVHRRDASP